MQVLGCKCRTRDPAGSVFGVQRWEREFRVQIQDRWYGEWDAGHQVQGAESEHTTGCSSRSHREDVGAGQQVQDVGQRVQKEDLGRRCGM